MNRRKFLAGAIAAAVVPALPTIAAPAAAPITASEILAMQAAFAQKINAMIERALRDFWVDLTVYGHAELRLDGNLVADGRWVGPDLRVQYPPPREWTA